MLETRGKLGPTLTRQIRESNVTVEAKTLKSRDLTCGLDDTCWNYKGNDAIPRRQK